MRYILYITILGAGLFGFSTLAAADAIKRTAYTPSKWTHSSFNDDRDVFRNKDGALLPLEYKGKLTRDTRKMRVSDLQRKLNAQGADLVVDGIWGPKTSFAVGEFQRMNELPITGQVDAVTFDIISAN